MVHSNSMNTELELPRLCCTHQQRGPVCPPPPDMVSFLRSFADGEEEGKRGGEGVGSALMSAVKSWQ